MARYEDDYYRRSYRGFSMRPQPVRGDSLDPNYAGGEYHGNRMDSGYGWQAAYGRHRLNHAQDLGRFGGYDGIEHRDWRLLGDSGTYEPVRGYDRGYRHRDEEYWHGYEVPNPRRGYDRDQRVVEDGGVRRDNRYLHDYNADSPAFRYGGAYDRSFGHAEGAPGRRPGEGPYGDDRFERDANRYGGKSSGGFTERWLPKHHP